MAVIRTFSQWHEHPRLVALAATSTGRIIVCVVAAALLHWHGVWVGPAIRSTLGLVVWVMALSMLWPARRREILSGASVLALLAWFKDRDLPGLTLFDPETWNFGAGRWLRFAVLAGGTLLGLILCLRVAHSIPRWPSLVRRFPVLCLHACAWAGLALIPAVPVLGVTAEILPLVLWRVSYLVQYCSRSAAPRPRFRDHFFYLWPLVGVSSSVPVGKGLDYLQRQEAPDRLRLAGSQLAGIKLLGLALVWTVLGWSMDGAVFGDPRGPACAWFGGWSLGLPALPTLLVSHHTTTADAVVALYLHLMRETLRFAAIGHVIAGCWRLLGFRIFREVYRPLLAESVLEFWNRRTWYLKELLSEFFFYPTFIRAKWAPPRLRLFLAIFAAAGVGNLYCHALERGLVKQGEPNGPALASHAVYSALLAVGIWISMLRERSRRRGEPVARAPWNRLRACFGVWTFYAVVHLWSINVGSLGPLARLKWLAAALTP